MTGSSTDTPPEHAPSVLVVLVVRDAAGWLRGCLSALGAQTYPRMGVVAVDDASSDGSHEILLGRRSASGASSPPTSDRGLAGSVRAALEIPAARSADYLLVLHDDTALDPDAVTRLVEAAIGMRVENVGVVGPKVVDWEEPRLLRDVGSLRRPVRTSVHAAPAGRDRSRAVRSRDRGPVRPDVRHVDLAGRRGNGRDCSTSGWTARHDDLDFCWRARLAGFHVLMTPLARARHRRRDRRPANVRPSAIGGRERYYEERAAIVAMLKNYVAAVPPVAAAAGVRSRCRAARVPDRSRDGSREHSTSLAAWGWNIVHLPGTDRSTGRAQSVRTVPDRQLRRFMESAGCAAATMVHRRRTDLRRAARDRRGGRGGVRWPAAP